MPLEIWLTYLTTVLLLMSTPGPSHLLMLSNSMRYGFLRSLATAAGDLSANTLQMLAAALGLAAVLQSSATAFTLIKWLGVGYLVWLGVGMIRGRQIRADGDLQRGSILRRQLWLQGFVTSATNPKAVVFFAALFPQFIDPAAPFWSRLVTLSVTYLIIDGAFLISYGLGAAWIGRRLASRGRIWLDRLGGVFLIGAALLLGLKSIEHN